MASELETRGADLARREKLFGELLAARSDVSSLTPSQLLVKDMKIASGIPVPGLPVLVEVRYTFFCNKWCLICLFISQFSTNAV
jgi:hypothetical protein